MMIIKKSLIQQTFFVLVCASLMVGFGACSSEGGSASSSSKNKRSAKAINALEYDYLMEEYTKNPDAALEKDLSKTEIFAKSIESEYQREAAKFGVKAYRIERKGDDAPIAILIEMDIDRLFTTLGGAPQRKEVTQYFCIPGSGATDALHEKYLSSVQELGVKDYEIYISNLSKLLAEVYM